MKTCPRLVALTCALLFTAAPLLKSQAAFQIRGNTRELSISGSTPDGHYSLSTSVVPLEPSTVSLSYTLQGVGSSASLTSWLTPTELNGQIATSVFHEQLPPGFGDSDAFVSFNVNFSIIAPTSVVFQGFMPADLETGTNRCFIGFDSNDTSLIAWWPGGDAHRTEQFLLNPGDYSLYAVAVNRLATHQYPYPMPLEQHMNVSLRIVPDSNSTVLCAALGLLALAALRVSLRSRAAFGLK